MTKIAKIEELDHNRTRYTFEVSPEEFVAELTAVYHRTAKKYTVPGVRKGHAAPRKVIENNYGEYVFYNDAIDSFYNKMVSEVLKEKGFYYDPECDITKMSETEGLEFVVTFDKNLEVELGEYKGIKLKKTDYTVHKKDVEEAVDSKLNKELDDHATEIEITDRAVKNGDVTVIDFSGSVDGVKFDGGSAENYELTIGSGSFIPGFEEQLIGMNIGEDKDISVKFPENYQAENLAGKDAIFAIKLHAIREKQLPEANDEFISEISEYETLEDYRKQSGKAIEKEMRANMEQKKKSDALLALISNAKTCVIPYALVKRQTENEIMSYYSRMGLPINSFEEFCKMVNQTPDQVRATQIDDTERKMQIEILLDKVAVAENIEVTDDEVNDYIKAEADKAFTDENADKKQSFIDKTVADKEICNSLKYQLRLEKAQQVVFDTMEVK